MLNSSPDQGSGPHRSGSVYRIVPYAAALDSQIVSLQEPLWGADAAASLRYLHWKYLENPYLAEPLICLVMFGDQLVAMRGMFGARWSADGDGAEVMVPIAGDTVVRADHQSRGLFRLLDQALSEELRRRRLELAFNLSAGVATSLKSQRAGWRLVPRFDLVRRSGVRSRRSRRALAALTSKLSRVRVADHPDTKGLADVVASRPGSRKIRHVRDVEYLSWRYRNPLRRYRFFSVGSNPMRGYLVMELGDDRFGRATSIVDWEARRPDDAERLLDAALRAEGRTAIMTWTGPLVRTYPETLASRGFRPQDVRDKKRRFEPGILVTSSKGPETSWRVGGLDVLDPQNWDMRFVYSDDV